jgi:hypothetical protein
MAKEERPAHEYVRDFLADAAERSDAETVYVGIDPGTSGAIGFVCGEEACAVDIPVYRTEVVRTKKLSKAQQAETGKKTKRVHGTAGAFDLTAICRVFSCFREAWSSHIVVTVEKVPYKVTPGPLTMGDIRIYGAWAMWPLYVTSLGLQLHEPPPATWKNEFSLHGKGKEDSRQAALRLFPECPDLTRKMDHDRAEAILLAVYGKRKANGEQS